MHERIFLAIAEEYLLNSVKSYLTQNGFRIAAEVEDGPSALRHIRRLKCDLALIDIDLPGLNGLDVAQIIEEENIAPVLLLVDSWRSDYLSQEKGELSAVLVKPFSENALLAAVDTALYNYRRYNQLKAEAQKLKENLETRKLVEKAKGILMEAAGISEEEAFRRLQRQSMNKSKPLKEIAEAVITAYELNR